MDWLPGKLNELRSIFYNPNHTSVKMIKSNLSTLSKCIQNSTKCIYYIFVYRFYAFKMTNPSSHIRKLSKYCIYNYLVLVVLYMNKLEIHKLELMYLFNNVESCDQ